MTKTKKNSDDVKPETRAETRAETQSVTWRMPVWVAEAHAGDWSEFREVLDKWASEPTQLLIEVPEDTTSVCLRVSVETLEALEKEAKRLSKNSKRKWTAGKVARAIYEELYQPEDK